MKHLFSQLSKHTNKIVFIVLFTFGNVFSTLFLPNLMSQIVDKGLANADVPYILKTSVFMLLTSIVGSMCTILVGLLAAKVAASVATDLRSRIFKKTSHFTLNQFDGFGASSLITRTTNDVTQIQQVTTMILRMVLTAPIMMVGAIFMAVQKSPKMSAVLVITVPMLLLVVFLLIRKAMPLFESIQKKVDQINLVAREKLSGVRVLRAFVTDEYEKARFDAANKDLTNSTIQVNRIMMLMMPTLSLMLNFTIIAVLWIGAKQIDMQLLGVGDLMAFIQYIQQVLMSFMMMTAIIVMVPRAGVSMNRIQAVLESTPQNAAATQGDSPFAKGASLRFENVTFQYEGASEPALSGIRFVANPGQTTAIIGSTGSGKSTLAKLIPRLYEPSSGQILIGDTPTTNMATKELRAHIGFVPQKALLFSGTVKSNLLYGDEQASEQDLQNALAIAQAEGFVFSHEKGLDREVSQGGTNLSGGQKQRLSIARALVRKPEIYIFDDSFSALDYQTDATLRAALAEVTKGKIVLIIAQRISTIMQADKILVLDEGKLVGTGTHEELLKTCPVYLEIAKSQLGEEALQ